MCISIWIKTLKDGTKRMAGLRASDLTAAIVEGVSKSLAKILLPKVRKMIREEIARGMEQVISETKVSSVATPASTQAA